MSALGQERTYAAQTDLSALPPIATSIAFFGMSALGQKRTSDVCFGPKRTSPILLDHLIGARDQRRRHCETERLGGLEIDGKLKLCRQLNRKIARLLAFENPSYVNAGSAVSVRLARSITDQSAGGDGPAEHIARGDCVERGEPDQLVAPGIEKWAPTDQ